MKIMISPGTATLAIIYQKHYTKILEIMIDDRNFFEHSVKNMERTNKKLRKITTKHGNIVLQGDFWIIYTLKGTMN